MLAVAAVSAAIGDPLVETLANSGTFGAGFDDHNHTSVIPVLAAGLMLALIAVAKRCAQLFGAAAQYRRRDWVVVAVTTLAGRSPWRDIPYVLALQLAALFAMENVEAVSIDGHFAAGAAWLGGPILLSLAVHATMGIALTVGLARFVSALSHTLGEFVRDALEVILTLARGIERALTDRRDRPSVPRVAAPHIRQLGGRAPPRLPRAV